MLRPPRPASLPSVRATFSTLWKSLRFNYPQTFTTNWQLPNHLRPFCEAAAGQVSGKQTNKIFFFILFSSLRSIWWPCDGNKDVICGFVLLLSCFHPLACCRGRERQTQMGCFFSFVFDTWACHQQTSFRGRVFFEDKKGSMFVKYYVLATLGTFVTPRSRLLLGKQWIG